MRLSAIQFALLLFALLSSSACSVYTGKASSLQPQELKREAGWLAVDGVPMLRQTDAHDCGPTALSMVLSYWQPGSPRLRTASDQQISAGEMRDLAAQHGFSAYVVAGTAEDLVYELKHGRPVIVGTAKQTLSGALSHYEVVIGMHRESQRVATLDPAAGYRQNTFAGFLTEWTATGQVLLVIVPQPRQARATDDQRDRRPVPGADVSATPAAAAAQAQLAH